MAEACSSKVKCPICNEDVFSLKILPCKHKFCLACLVQESSLGERGRKCPNCRKPHNLAPKEIEALPTLYYGKFQCTVCKEPEDVIESFWCSECAHLMCRKCTIKHLKSTPGHTTSEWSDLQAVKDCASHSLKMSQWNQQDATPGVDEKKVIKEFRNSLENQLLAQLEMMKQRSVANSEVAFHEKLTDLFGKLDLSEASPLPASIPLNRLQRAAGQILGVANGSQMSGDQESNYFQPLKQKVLKCFQDKPEELAQSLLSSANMEEIEVSKALMPYAASLEESLKAPVNLFFNQLGDLECTDDFLASLHDQYILPAGTEFEWWVYKGTGKQLLRLLKIIDKNLQFSKCVSLILGDHFIPLRIIQNTNIDSLKIEAGKTPLAEQSAQSFSKCITSLINNAPQLQSIGVLGKGYPVSWMKEVWSHLPSSLLKIGIHKIQLTTSEINDIAGKYSNSETWIIELGYCCASWKSCGKLLTEIIQTRSGIQLLIVTLKDYTKDVYIFGRKFEHVPEIFEKFLREALQFKGSLWLQFSDFELTEAHWRKLRSCLKMPPSNLQKILFQKMICKHETLENLKIICDQKNIDFHH